jgi:hypothetical protein
MKMFNLWFSRCADFAFELVVSAVHVTAASNVVVSVVKVCEKGYF